jgi:indolepyruvate ferredoxin oxidoreductase beta subunit
MNVLVCGVGGQGVLLFTGLLAQVALAAGQDVKKSEVHGMAQRGGSVSSHVRFGPKVFSPLIDPGTADLVVAFERLEAVRYVHYLRSDGRILYDPHRIDPVPVQLGLVKRPEGEDLDRRLRGRAASIPIAAFAAARELGNARVQNVIMLGAAAPFLGLPEGSYRDAIRTLVKPNFVELNLRAFDTGRGMVATAMAHDSVE